MFQRFFMGTFLSATMLVSWTVWPVHVAGAEKAGAEPRYSGFDHHPFPFSEKSVEEEMDASTFAAEVPVPPDTIALAAFQEAPGYVPDVYGRPAPSPSPVLRPRYLTDSSSKSSSKSASGSVEKASGAPVKRSSKIRQVAGENAHHPSTLKTPPTVARIESDGFFAEPVEPTKPIESAGPPKSDFVVPPPPLRTLPDLPEAGATAINNAHTCDELTCGAGGCSSFGSLRHLSSARPRRGLCECCGLFTCANKTVGPWYVDGWMSVGATMNTHWPDGRDNRPLLYNDRNGEPVMNQLYLSFGRRVDTRKNRWDLGARVDLLYGTDYFYTSSLGLETRRTSSSGSSTLDPHEAALRWNSNNGHRRDGTASLYGLSLPQAYAEIFMPFGDGVTIKAGQFYSEMGLESAMSPRNFFYSHSYGFMYGAPTTLTGATATVKLGSQLSAMVGFSQGWDVWDSPTDNISGLFGVHWKSRDKKSALSFLLHTGEESLRGSDNRTSYTLTYQRQLARHWHYALEHSFGYEKNGSLRELMTNERGPARWVSLAQYLQWEWSEKLSLGFRFEWFRDDGHSRVQKGAAVHSPLLQLIGKDYYEMTLGLNWKPTRYVTIRPELRYDWSNVKVHNPWLGSLGAYGEKREMLSFAIDGVFRF